MTDKTYFDISVPLLEATVVWPGDDGFERELYATFETGTYQASKIRMGSHSGTHIDAPAHFIPGGETIDMLPLEVLVGEALVAEVPISGAIARADLEAVPLSGISRLLLKTPNSALYEKPEFSPDFTYIDLSAADYLIERGIKLVGIDYLSIAEFHKGAAVHKRLLSNGVIVLETINLSGVEPGRYELFCLPLRIADGDGSPARAILRSL